MKQNNALRLLLLFGLSLLPVRAWSQKTAEIKPFILNYRPDGAGRPYIDVSLNENVLAPFAIDTGASVSIISDKLAKRLGLMPQPAFNEKGKPVIINGKPAKSVMVRSIQIGPLTLTGPLIVVKSSELANADDAPANEKVDGIIGFNTLTVFTVLFNFQYHQITLW